MTDLPHPLPDRLEIRPLAKPPVATIRVPGSKSITNRALILAALSDPFQGSCELIGVSQSEDTEILVTALRDLGFIVQTDWTRARAFVRRPIHAPTIPVAEAN